MFYMLSFCPFLIILLLLLLLSLLVFPTQFLVIFSEVEHSRILSIVLFLYFNSKVLSPSEY